MIIKRYPQTFSLKEIGMLVQSSFVWGTILYVNVVRKFAIVVIGFTGFAQAAPPALILPWKSRCKADKNR